MKTLTIIVSDNYQGGQCDLVYPEHNNLPQKQINFSVNIPAHNNGPGVK